MKILIIGLGSMGKRRVNLIQRYYKDKIEIVGIDTQSSRRLEVENKFNIQAFKSLDEAMKVVSPIGVFICTSPISHADLIIDCLNKGLHIFTEINLLQDRYDEIISLANKSNLQLFLSSTFLYRKEIQMIEKEVKQAPGKINYRYHVGQYLPDWHPWENFKDFFVSNIRTNACRELFAIEMPWIIKVFGRVKNISVIKNEMSSLDLGYPDSYIVILEHEGGHVGVLSVDVISRKATRDLEIYSENLHLFWKGTPNSLEKYDIEAKEMYHIQTYDEVHNDNRYADNIIENAYLEEIKIFIKMINGERDIEKYTFEQDKYTLDLIDKIEGV